MVQCSDVNSENPFSEMYATSTMREIFLAGIPTFCPSFNLALLIRLQFCRSFIKTSPDFLTESSASFVARLTLECIMLLTTQRLFTKCSVFFFREDAMKKNLSIGCSLSKRHICFAASRIDVNVISLIFGSRKRRILRGRTQVKCFTVSVCLLILWYQTTRSCTPRAQKTVTILFVFRNSCQATVFVTQPTVYAAQKGKMLVKVCSKWFLAVITGFLRLFARSLRCPTAFVTAADS